MLIFLITQVSAKNVHNRVWVTKYFIISAKTSKQYFILKA